MRTHALPAGDPSGARHRRSRHGRRASLSVTIPGRELFGRRDGTGPFIPLPPNAVARISHYRAPRRGGIAGLFARFDDVARTVDPEGRWIPTFDDPPTPCRIWRFVVLAPTHLARR